MEVFKIYKDYVSIEITDDLKATINLFLKEIKSILKAQKTLLFFFNVNKELYPIDIGEPVSAKDEELAKFFYEHKELKYLNPNNNDFNVEYPTIGYSLFIPEGEIGIIIIQSSSKNLFFDSDYQLVKNIFSSLATILRKGILFKKDLYIPFKNSILLLLENTSLILNNSDLNKKLYALLEVSNFINSSKKLEEMLRNILESATKVLRAESASIFLVDNETGDLVFDIILEDSNLRGIRVPKGKGIVGKAAETQQSIIVNDVNSDPNFYKDIDRISLKTTRNLMASPLIVNNEVIGVIEVINTLDRPDFSKNDLILFQSFADSVAIAIQRRRLLDYIEAANIQLEQKVRELTTLHNIAKIIVENNNFNEMIDKVLDCIQNELKINKLSFTIFQEHKNSFEILSSKGIYVDKNTFEPKLIKYVWEKNIPFYIKNFDLETELKQLSNPERYKKKTAILIPLTKSNGKPFGILCAADPDHKNYFEADDFRLLITIGSQIAKTYENFEFTAIQKEIEVTARIQKDILPSKIFHHHALEFYANTIPAKTTSGDFFDYFSESPYGNCSFVIADVSGKSLPAAIFMAMASSILRTMLKQEEELRNVLYKSNELIYEESESGMFVTCFVARYNAIEGILEYSSAGHNQMILIHSDTSYELLTTKGTPLGVIIGKETKYEQKSIRLKKDDLLILYTDGITEATNIFGEEYGLERFIECLRIHKNLHPKEIFEKVYKDVKAFSNKEFQDDDFTMIIIKFNLKFTKNIFILDLPANIKSVPRLINELHDILSRYKIKEDLLNDILLACDEISTNICLYAYKDLEKDKKGSFRCKVYFRKDQNNRNYVLIVFIDKGKKYNFESKKPNLEKNLSGEKEGGFGIYLVNILMDKVIHKNINNKNYLFLIKYV